MQKRPMGGGGPNNQFRRDRNREAPIDKDAPRINEQIRAPEIRVIGPDGEMLGVMHPKSALDAARDAGMDLIEISPNAAPPVCKIGDYGKYRYEMQKKKNEAKKNQKVVEVKEIKLRPNIDDHDYGIKLRKLREFIDEGNKVKITLRFRGREMANMAINTRILEKVRGDIADYAKIEHSSGLEGRQMNMMIAPLSKQERDKVIQQQEREGEMSAS